MRKLRIAPASEAAIETNGEPSIGESRDETAAQDPGAAPLGRLAADPLQVDAVHRLGHILMELGRLEDQQVKVVLAQQAQTRQRFGDTAISMGLVERVDIDLALARQFDVDFSPALDTGIDPQLLPDTLGAKQSEALRAVRSQLVLRWFGNEPEQRTLAILSSHGGEGRSHLCAHLGVMLSQMDEDTLVIDADLRKPSMHTFFDIDNRSGLANYLSRDIVRAPIRAVRGNPRLHVMPAGPSTPQAQALLERRQFAQLLDTLAKRYAFILIDTPPASQHSEAITLAVRASGCLLVARRNRSRMADAQRLAEQLGRHSVEVLGAVINER